MKKQTNQNNNSVGNTYLSKRFRMKMKQNTKIFIVTLLLQLLGIPAAMICGSMVSGHYISDFATVNSYEYLYKLSLYILAAAVLSGVFTAVKTFSYLHSRSDTDITLSLPLSRKQLFLADYLSGFLTYIIPYIIVLFLTMPAWFSSAISSAKHTPPFAPRNDDIAQSG